MKITPLDLQQYPFKKKWQGLDPDDVRGFLDLVRAEMEDLLRENNALKDEIKRTLARVAEYREHEQTLKDTMLTAQRLSTEVKAQAVKEAETVVAGAEVKAQEIIQQAAQRATKLQGEIRELRRQKVQFEENLRAMLATHMKMLGMDEEKQNDLFEDKVAFLSKKEKG